MAVAEMAGVVVGDGDGAFERGCLGCAECDVSKELMDVPDLGIPELGFRCVGGILL